MSRDAGSGQAPDPTVQPSTEKWSGEAPPRWRSYIVAKAVSMCVVKSLVSNSGVFKRWSASLRLMSADLSRSVASSIAVFL